MEGVTERFLSVSSGSGSGSGSGYGSGGDGSGYGGYGSGSGSGSGSGYGGYGYGSGSGSGSGSGYGGSGSGYGGSGSGSGYGGSGSGVKSFNGIAVHLIDGVQTIIKKVRGMVAEGFILKTDLSLQPCFIAKSGDSFAHGDTIKEAVAEAESKAAENTPEGDRIARFLAQFPNGGSGHDLFVAHGWLTGSCKTGRQAFVDDRQIDLDKTFTLAEFVELCQNAYGGETVRKLTGESRRSE